MRAGGVPAGHGVGLSCYGCGNGVPGALPPGRGVGAGRLCSWGGRTAAAGPGGTGGVVSPAGGDTPAVGSGGQGDAARVIAPRSLHAGAALCHLRPRGAGAGAVWDSSTRRFRWQELWVRNVARAEPGEVPRAVPRAYPRGAGLYPVARGSRAGAGAGRGAAAVTGPGGPVPGLGWAGCGCAALCTGSAGMQHPRRGPGDLRCVFVGFFWGKHRASASGRVLLRGRGAAGETHSS